VFGSSGLESLLYMPGRGVVVSSGVYRGRRRETRCTQSSLCQKRDGVRVPGGISLAGVLDFRSAYDCLNGMCEFEVALRRGWAGVRSLCCPNRVQEMEDVDESV
jgi:hypothetical protein